MSLPQFQTTIRELQMLETQWASQLNPVIESPIVNGLLLQNLPLSSGDNVINHKLGRKLIGYFVTRNSSPVTFYDKQDSNQMPTLTLVLNSSGAATIDLWVF